MVVEDGGEVFVVREFDAAKDSSDVEEVERKCEVGPSGKLCLFTDLLGDPLCRIRNSPAFLMLVAEMVVAEKKEIVGMIRGCIKTVTCGTKLCNDHSKPLSTKAAYILGLRVSPSHRRLGIGLKLVCKMEEWFKENGVEYSYIATESDNQPSVKLFTLKCGYSKFRTPSILVQPVFGHRVKVTSRVSIIKLSPSDAETLYRLRFATTEFFPHDIDSILNNKLSLGTYLAVPKGSLCSGANEFLASQPESWAVLSVWNCKEVFKLEVRGASSLRRLFAKTTRLVDRAFPALQLPSVPDVFRPFGLHFLYGLGGKGPLAVNFMKALCGFAHNFAKQHGCGVVATEVASLDPLRFGVPHWKRLSCDEDLWCIKRLSGGNNIDGVGDWTMSTPRTSIFVDPREF
ncbi:acyltransferase [Lithospermum erythrorhizon]|uniref:Acyltransferase n=1 Tax=Lithospermum erythrorhizon TaxID=34254 RepID=A0AAV3R920_LITER